MKRNLVPLLTYLSLLVLAALLVAGCQPLSAETAQSPPSESSSDPAPLLTNEAKIQNAMAAAPPAISEAATIRDWELDADGQFVELRAGTNEWTCFPDWDVTPTDDPMCVDAVWLNWQYAMMEGREPEISTVGISYMLLGGSDASNTDPFATEPAEGEEWLIGGPHMMLLSPVDLDPADFTTDYNSGHPFIMWEGTPYEHLMVPVE